MMDVFKTALIVAVFGTIIAFILGLITNLLATIWMPLNYALYAALIIGAGLKLPKKLSTVPMFLATWFIMLFVLAVFALYPAVAPFFAWAQAGSVMGLFVAAFIVMLSAAAANMVGLVKKN